MIRRQFILTICLIAMGAPTMADDKAPPAKQDLVIVRKFDAPVAQVWKAWSEPELVQKWWGPTGFTCPLARLEFKKGGKSLVCMRAPKEFGGQDMYSTWEYREIDPMKRIEYVHNLTDKDGKPVDPTKMGLPADFPQNQRHVITFKSIGDATELTVTEYGWSPGQMMEMSKLGMNQCLDKMAVIFSRK